MPAANPYLEEAVSESNPYLDNPYLKEVEAPAVSLIPPGSERGDVIQPVEPVAPDVLRPPTAKETAYGYLHKLGEQFAPLGKFIEEFSRAPIQVPKASIDASGNVALEPPSLTPRTKEALGATLPMPPEIKIPLAASSLLPDTAKKAVVGLYNAGTGFANFMLSPAGVATAGVADAPKAVQSAVSAYYGGTMAYHLPEVARQAGEAFGRGDIAKAVELTASGIGGLVLSGVLGGTAVAKAREAIRPKTEVKPPPIPPVEELKATVEANKDVAPVTADVVAETIKPKEPNASSIEKTATVYEPLPAQPVKGEAQMPVDESGKRVQSLPPETPPIESAQPKPPTVPGEEVPAKGEQSGVEPTVKEAGTVESAAKEPWQMTKKEYHDQFPRTEATKVQTESELNATLKEEAKSLEESGDITIEKTKGGQNFRAKTESGRKWIADAQRRSFDRLNQAGMSAGIRANEAATIAGESASHKIAIQEAIRAGETIPPEVLADYPDLAVAPEKSGLGAGAATTPKGAIESPTAPQQPKAAEGKPVWKVSYTDLETRAAKHPFFKLTVYSEGMTRAEAIERVKNYHGNSARYGEFRASKAEGKQADSMFRAVEEQPPLAAPEPKGELGSRGPGAAATGEPGSYDPASQLTDQLKTIKETDPLKRAEKSSRMADAWASGKSFLERSWGKVAAAKESIKSNLLTLPEATPIKRLVAALDFQIQSSSARSRELGRAFESAHPNRIRRNGMAILIDAGMDVGKVNAAIAELPAKVSWRVRKSFEAAANLSPHELATAQRIKTYFEQRLQDAQQAGVLEKFLEDYYTHVWKNTKSMPKELAGAMNSGRVVSYFENARKRTLESFIEGVKLGYEPVLDPALVLPRYNFNLDRAIASRAFIKELTKTKEADGRPTAAPTGSATKLEGESGTDATLIRPSTKSEATGDYKTIDNPALTKWKWVENDPEGKPILVQGDLAIHPDALERVRNLMDRTRLTPSGAMRTAIHIGAEVKGAKLGVLSPFHQVHVGSHALWHLVNPFNLKPEIDWTHPATKFAVESGLKLAADFHDRTAFSEGIGPGLIAQKIVPYARAYSEYLFESFIPRLKLKTFETVYQRDLKRYEGKLSPEQIASRSADAVNSAYGELNRLWLGRNGRDPRLQRGLQVTLLAPDFLEARGRFVGKAFTKYGKEERMALFVMAGTLYTTARVLNQLLDDDPHAKELGMMFSVRHNGRNYSVRSVIGDTTHLLSDWRSFTAHRINPATTRTVIEAISGRELRTGLKRDTVEQAEDLLRQIVPSQLDSMLPGDRAWFEGLSQSLGITSRRQPTPEEIRKREAREAKEKKNPPAYEFIYNPAHKKK